MMTPRSLAALLGPLVVIAVTGCPDDGSGNPRTLWLAPDGSELRVKLVDAQPPSF